MFPGVCLALPREGLVRVYLPISRIVCFVTKVQVMYLVTVCSIRTIIVMFGRLSFGPEPASKADGSVEYKHYGLMLCPNVHGVMVDHQCVLYVGWSRYAAVEGVLWL